MGRIMRYILIVNYLYNHDGGVPYKEIYDYLKKEMNIRGFDETGIDIRAFQRDKRDIEDIFGVSIKYKKGYGYFIDFVDKTATIQYDQLLLNFDLLTSIGTDYSSMGYILPEHHRPRGFENIYTLLDAIKNNLIIRFNYTLYRKDGKVIQKEVKPYFLKESLGFWYLICKDENNEQRVYGVDRISKLYTTGRTFKRDKEVDHTKMFQHSYGIWDDPETPVEEVELAYSERDGSFLKSVPLHSSQEILRDDAKEFRIRLKVKITNDFVMALLSRSKSLTVIKPLHLRERIAEIYREALDRNT